MEDKIEVHQPEEIKFEIPPERSLTTTSNPDYLIELAINKNLDIEKLEKLMQLKREWDAQQAKLAFNEAMAEFQMKCPLILKSTDGGKTKEGQVAYKFASIGDILSTKVNGDNITVKELIAKCGFSYLIKTPQLEEGKIGAVCIVKHKMGHSEESSIVMPYLRQTNVMSDAQVVAGTSTFAKRYAFSDAFGIMTADEDRDGIGENLKELFESRIKDYRYKDHIRAVEGTIQSASTYKQFLETLPTEEQIKRFITALDKLKYTEAVNKSLWDLFQKHNKDSVNKLLTDLENKTKEK